MQFVKHKYACAFMQRFFVSTACKSTSTSVLFQSTHLHSYDGLSLGEAYKATDTAVVQFHYHRFAALSKLLNI